MKSYLVNKFIPYLDSINFEDKTVVEVLKTKDEKFGDYTSNIAMRLTKALGKNPMEIAEEIKTFLESTNNGDIESITVTNPGFVNIFLSKDLIINLGLKYSDENYKPKFDSINKLKINYEYVSANPTGDLHIGHARNAVVGLIVVNALKYIGHDVYTEYYVNDGGKQMIGLAESVYYYFAPLANLECTMQKEEVSYHGEEIQGFAQKLFDENFVLEGKDEKERISNLVKISGDHFLKEIKDLLENKLNLPEFDQWTSEAGLFTSGEVEHVFDLFKKLDAIYEKDGATWLRTEKYGDEKDRVIIKADGSNTYMVADMANHANKYERGFDLMIDLWGMDHHGYEDRIQAGLEAIGMGGKLIVDFISMVKIMKGDEEFKMSKRAGTSLRIKDILAEMESDVFKYFLITKAKEKNMKIDILEVTKQDLNNPYYYVQYANARVNQIIEKYKNEIGEIELLTSFNKLGEVEQEKALITKMIEFEDVLISINNEREPSLLANYQLELAQIFNSYYAACKVVTEDIEQSTERINLMVALKNQFSSIFEIMGITPITKI